VKTFLLEVLKIEVFAVIPPLISSCVVTQLKPKLSPVPVTAEAVTVHYAVRELTPYIRQLKAFWLTEAPVLSVWVDDMPGQTALLASNTISW
jgi:hypothetical protein